MKKLAITLIAILAFCTSCTKNEVADKVYNPEKIASIENTINTAKDTTLLTPNGTKVRIYKNTFVDLSGDPITVPVKIEIKEVLTPADMVLSNMTTTADGKILQSGGMIYLNATADGNDVYIADEMAIGIVIPAKEVNPQMQIYYGDITSQGVNWVSPVPILNDMVREMEFENTTIWYTYPEEATKKQIKMIEDTLLNKYINITKDTQVMVGALKIEMKKPIKEKVKVTVNEGNEVRFSQEVLASKGTNNYLEDYNSSYIFAVRNLGWANIDMVYEDPRCKLVDLKTVVENAADFKQVYVSMVMSKQNIYIPGYQKEDDSYSFNANDAEPTKLPVGETVTILATAYKDDQPYFAMKQIVIAEKQKVSLKLNLTTHAKLKESLQKNL